MALRMKFMPSVAGQHHLASRSLLTAPKFLKTVSPRSRLTPKAVAQLSDDTSEGKRTAIIKDTPGEMPLPWSEKDPYKLPVSIDRVQRLLFSLGWDRPWVEQIVDRIMKSLLRTTEERTQEVINTLTAVGLRQDEICNMASISVVLLGLNPETRIKPVLDYLRKRGVPENGLADLLLMHPRIFEYKVDENATSLHKGRARIQVDVLPGPGESKAAAVNYFRDMASFLEAPVSPVGPAS